MKKLTKRYVKRWIKWPWYNFFPPQCLFASNDGTLMFWRRKK